MDELSELRTRIDALEVKTEVQGLLITALLGLVPDERLLLIGLDTAIELHHANALYATSLSDGQRQRVFLNLRGMIDVLKERHRGP
jgi:hypothetical protein